MRCLRAGLPDRQLARKELHRDGTAGADRPHDLRLLRRRLQFQGRTEGRRGRAHGAVEGRQGQSRPFLHQGPLRLGLRQPPGPYPEADGARQDHRPVARSVVGGGDRADSQGIHALAKEIRPDFGWRHHLVALHRRRNLPDAEIGTSGPAQQQHRYLRPRLPLADGLRSLQDVRDVGRHAGFRFGRRLRT